jgi:hypothetical protein
MAEQRDALILSSSDVDGLRTELNMMLQRIADRLDRVEGLREDPTFWSNVFKYNNVELSAGNVLNVRTDEASAEFDDTLDYESLILTGDLTVEGTSDLDNIDTKYIDFNLTADPNDAFGRLRYDPADYALNFQTPLGNIIQIGQEQYGIGVNKTGGTATDGECVYLSGVQGNRPTFDYADARDGAKCSLVGLVTATTLNNAEGPITTFGFVRDFDTSSWVVGTKLYIAADATGALTSTPPSKWDFRLWVATVTNQHATQGSVFVAPRIDFAQDTTFNGLDIISDLSLQDDGKAIFGTGDDADLLYDGTDLILTTDRVAASDFVVDCGTNKTIELSEVVYDDQQVSIGSVGFGASAPSWTAYKSGEVLAFANNQSNKITFNAQLSHRYKLGTNIDFHIHTIAPNNNSGDVRWQLTYSWADIGSDFPAETTTLATQTIAANSQDEHLYFEIDDAVSSASAEAGVSGVLICSLTRLGSDGADTYASSIYLAALDFHFQINTIGSRQELVK